MSIRGSALGPRFLADPEVCREADAGAHRRAEMPPDKRDMLVFDVEQRGLGVWVTATGGKTFLAQYTFHGQKRRIPLGSCDAVSLAKARDAVRAIMGDVARGIDPAAERNRPPRRRDDRRRMKPTRSRRY